MSQRNDSAVCLPCLLVTLVSRNLQFTLHQNPLAIGTVIRTQIITKPAASPSTLPYKSPLQSLHSFPFRLLHRRRRLWLGNWSGLDAADAEAKMRLQTAVNGDEVRIMKRNLYFGANID